MSTRANITPENRVRIAAQAGIKEEIGANSTLRFIDNRPEAIAQRNLQEMANSYSAKQHAVFQIKEKERYLPGDTIRAGKEPIKMVSPTLSSNIVQRNGFENALLGAGIGAGFGAIVNLVRKYVNAAPGTPVSDYVVAALKGAAAGGATGAAVGALVDYTRPSQGQSSEVTAAAGDQGSVQPEEASSMSEGPILGEHNTIEELNASLRHDAAVRGAQIVGQESIDTARHTAGQLRSIGDSMISAGNAQDLTGLDSEQVIAGAIQGAGGDLTEVADELQQAADTLSSVIENAESTSTKALEDIINSKTPEQQLIHGKLE